MFNTHEKKRGRKLLYLAVFYVGAPECFFCILYALKLELNQDGTTVCVIAKPGVGVIKPEQILVQLMENPKLLNSYLYMHR